MRRPSRSKARWGRSSLSGSATGGESPLRGLDLLMESCYNVFSIWERELGYPDKTACRKPTPSASTPGVRPRKEKAGPFRGYPAIAAAVTGGHGARSSEMDRGLRGSLAPPYGPPRCSRFQIIGIIRMFRPRTGSEPPGRRTDECAAGLFLTKKNGSPMSRSSLPLSGSISEPFGSG